MRTVTTVPLDLPASAISRTRTHVQAMEEALARGRELPEALESARRSLDSLETSTAAHWRHLHHLTSRPGYRLLDNVARRVRRPGQATPPPPAPHRRRLRKRLPLPPIAIAAVETRELLAAAAQQCGDDPAMTQTVERASAELARIIPELTTAQALQAELDELDKRLQVGRARLAQLQNDVHAVQRRMNSRLLDTFRLPARSKRDSARSACNTRRFGGPWMAGNPC